ncbi:MAG: UvrB/UvrC motif-containing protein [Phycisphaerales bacterium]|nr:UvrB/UvrC motif-containing protein [Phycisphaerales bacterium]
MMDDVSDFLASWPREPGQFQVRAVTAEDGRQLVQVRIDMGVVQMEAHGRPDGLPSVLERLEAHQEARTVLDAATCRALRDEAVMVHHRYVAMFNLKQFDAVVRDVRHNLRILDLCSRHAELERDRNAMEHLRPQILTMGVRADAEAAMAGNQPRLAMEAIDRGLAELTVILGPQDLEKSNEVQLLRGMRDLLVPKLPSSQRAELEERLTAALDAENYELAAILRDELRLMAAAKRSGERGPDG